MFESNESETTASSRSRFALETTVESDRSTTLNDRIQRNQKSLTSFLVSLTVHTALLLALLLLVYQVKPPIPRIGLVATFDAQATFQNPQDVHPNTLKIELPEDNQSPVENMYDDLSHETETQIADSQNTNRNIVAENPTPSNSDALTPNAKLATLPTGGGLSGRDATARDRLAASRGGSRDSEMAVEAGLRWILDHQRDDGSWRFHHDDGRCEGQCSHEGEHESTCGATGLALLTLLGAGYTHRTGPHQEAVQKGLDHLLVKARYTAHGAILANEEDRMYSQAIATLAIAEAFTMTGDSNLVHAIEAARKYSVAAQHGSGSWGYVAGSRGDITLTGWHLMALKSCQMAGFPSDRQVWQNAETFIDSLGSSHVTYRYKPSKEGTPATTAIGLLSKMYLGMPLEHRLIREGGNWLVDQGPSKTDIYFNYYATQVLHHRQGTGWKTWNREMRDYLVTTQIQGDGHNRGSWYFKDPHGKVGGRLYTTAMAVMILEVYYRYLPLYERQAVQSQTIQTGYLFRQRP